VAARHDPAPFRPKVTYDTYRSAPIDSYYEDVAAMWQRDHHERSVLDLWLHVTDHASRLGVAVHQQSLSDLTESLADTAVWLMSLITQCRDSRNPVDQSFRFSQSPADIIWNKYPGTCPGCFDAWLLSYAHLKPEEATPRTIEVHHAELMTAIEQRAERYTAPMPCTCLTRCAPMGQEAPRPSSELVSFRLAYAARLRALGHQIPGIGALGDMFQTIYAQSGRGFTLETAASHLLEQVGQASRALKDCYTYDDGREPYSPSLHAIRLQRLRDYLAAVFAWLYRLSFRVRETHGRMAREYLGLTSPAVHCPDMPEGFPGLADVIWFRSGRTVSGANWAHLKCPGCTKAPCECRRDLRMARRVGEPSEGERDLVFVSYSHKDGIWLERLETMLRPLVRNLTLSVWDDRKIRPGQLWREEIVSALSRARVAVLLVSAEFLASDFIAEEELPPLLEAARRRGTRIIWVPVGACLFREAGLGEFQAAHDPGEPLEAMSVARRHAVLVEVCEAIKRAARREV
jgi:hypothetical protein